MSTAGDGPSSSSTQAETSIGQGEAQSEGGETQAPAVVKEAREPKPNPKMSKALSTSAKRYQSNPEMFTSFIYFF